MVQAEVLEQRVNLDLADSVTAKTTQVLLNAEINVHGAERDPVLPAKPAANSLTRSRCRASFAIARQHETSTPLVDMSRISPPTVPSPRASSPGTGLPASANGAILSGQTWVCASMITSQSFPDSPPSITKIAPVVKADKGDNSTQVNGTIS